MNRCWRPNLVCAATLLALSQLAIAETTGAPAAQTLPSAQPAWRSDPAKRCPELQRAVAEEGAVTVVQFIVGPTGVPSRASVRASSGSAGFDAAAMSCIMKLRFLPAVRTGDGAAVESWQQLALKWQGPVSAPQSLHCDAGASTPSDAQNSVVVAEAAEGGGGSPAQRGPDTSRAGVCVCVDATGKLAQPPVLTKSSGIPGFDKAALELSAAAHYRPASAGDGQPTPGCFRLKVGLEVK